MYEGMGKKRRKERSEAKPRGKVEERKKKKFRFLMPFLLLTYTSSYFFLISHSLAYSIIIIII
jgi:hypothetical protein